MFSNISIVWLNDDSLTDSHTPNLEMLSHLKISGPHFIIKTFYGVTFLVSINLSTLSCHSPFLSYATNLFVNCILTSRDKYLSLIATALNIASSSEVTSIISFVKTNNQIIIILILQSAVATPLFVTCERKLNLFVLFLDIFFPAGRM